MKKVGEVSDSQHRFPNSLHKIQKPKYMRKIRNNSIKGSDQNQQKYLK